MSATDSTTFGEVEYRDISGFPGYRVGSDGTVWTAWERFYPKGVGRVGVQYLIGSSWVEMKQNKMGKYGYLDVQLSNGVKSVHFLVHRIVLESFFGPRPEGMECAHEDGNPGNNDIGNLSWKTKKANQADRVRHGTTCRGENHGVAALTNDQAKEIRERELNGESIASLAREFGVSHSVAWKAARGVTYK